MRKTLAIILTSLLLFLVISCDLLIKKQVPAEDTGTDSFYFINNKIPQFSETEKNRAAGGYFIELSELDSLGRVGVAIACFDYEHMPTEDREPLSKNPTGWVNKMYASSIVAGGWIYNRSHILGFQLSGLNDVPENLMTGTRDFNAGKNSMVTFENMVADHMKEHRDHSVLYRVTPDFHGTNLLAHGVQMESDCLQCDDNADFNVYIRNIQKGITIDYATGDNWLSGEAQEPEETVSLENATFILNTKSDKFHKVGASCAPDSTSANYKLTDLTRDDLIADGYSPCGTCKP